MKIKVYKNLSLGYFFLCSITILCAMPSLSSNSLLINKFHCFLKLSLGILNIIQTKLVVLLFHINHLIILNNMRWSPIVMTLFNLSVIELFGIFNNRLWFLLEFAEHLYGEHQSFDIYRNVSLKSSAEALIAYKVQVLHVFVVVFE